MKIIYKIGDLLKASEIVLVHGVNSRGKFASGVAKVIRGAYPEVYDNYMLTYKTGKLKLGEIFPVFTENCIIINGVTQEFYGYDDKIYCDYNAIRSCMKKANIFCKENGINAIAMPKIGAGLGGGDFTVISAIIEEEFTDAQPVVYVLKENEIPA